MFCLTRNCLQSTQRRLGGSIHKLDPRRKFLTSLGCSFSSGTDRKETVGDEGVVQCNEVLFRPDAKSVYVHTFGCSHNMSDGETMKGLLAAGGYNVTTNKKDADVWYA
jgi:CDK5 regulatory subunit-associated protein 1-like 1